MSRKSRPSEPVKAYKNAEFLNSPDARIIRILAEYMEPAQRFRRRRVKDTVVFFGSARAAAPEEEAKPAAPQGQKRVRDLSRYYEDARRLAYKLTEWSKGLRGTQRRFTICSGGGPGIMEAANRGASEAGGETIGLNISLPHEQDSNPWISHNLNFEFHYFFVRKFWFVYLAKALVVFPGGFGTMDELFEILTLIQTNTVKKALPVVLYGRDFWREVINLDALVEWGTISPEDRDLFKLVDDPEEAFEYLREQLTEHYLDR